MAKSSEETKVVLNSKADIYERLWEEDPEIHDLLSQNQNLEEARKRLSNYLDQLEWEYREGKVDLHKLEWATAMEAIEVFKNVISTRDKEISGVDTFEYLFNLAQGKEGIKDELGQGFILEFSHLFKAINGEANFSEGWLGGILKKEGVTTADFTELEGREAGEARSDYLDKMGDKILDRLNRYSTGLDEDVIDKRKQNREKILDYFNADLEDWQSKQWQLKHIFKDSEDLEHLKELVPLSDEDEKAIKMADENNIPFGITPYYLSLFDFQSANRERDYQVRSQVIPPMHYIERMIEHQGDKEYYFDFMGEHSTSPKDLVTRRYVTIAILKAVDTCPQICVYCQRNWEITGPMESEGFYAPKKINEALDWFEEHPTMKDVLITGGDPFVLSDNLIEHITSRLSNMDHVKNIRWGTRTPVTMPMRITDELAEMLGSYIDPGNRNVCVVTHIEGANEITPELTEAVRKLRNQGIYVYNQQVFTLETSRRFQTAANRIAMKKAGIDPYYTFYTKGKEEHKDYLTPIARVWQERNEEARLLPGIFRTDEPVFNVPKLGKDHIRAWQDRELLAIRPDGRRVYLIHPWEKGIAPVEPWTYTDVSLHEYLQELERRGEDSGDYESIWYYY